MKVLTLPLVIAVAFLIGCSDSSHNPPPIDSVATEAAVAADAAEAAATPQPEKPAIRVGWSPNDACSFLNPILVTRGYKHDFEDEYHCSSPYKDIGASSAGLPNNLAYYVTGTSNVADTVKLVLNYNQPASASAATKELAAASRTLALKATGNEIPANVLSAISAGRAAVETSGEFTHEVKRDNWPTGRGYETHYIVTKSVER
ncbi:conserved hypothetical protein (plasmid) [Desulforapulum autotrophicum HRM2]|uniref:Lipoprotein n=1 Tax=Desulforapulum autotrophicum (strain ATCC 43914 / DSM 3382 / VKM B-1955 / HRM2) TaxID=177437 RepID=C0QMQ9_DESAH|nr:hypothetical protein [Desulforapulum autotrophicum]ACN18053.1 conserved hypothetical protein [Desulforapulum autotrophicum HRM2]